MEPLFSESDGSGGIIVIIINEKIRSILSVKYFDYTMHQMKNVQTVLLISADAYFVYGFPHLARAFRIC